MLEKCTLVLGLDRKHLEQLAMVWPTWERYKPELRKAQLCVFYDRDQLSIQDLRQVIDRRATVIAWPPKDVEYPEGDGSKWFNQQRVKMLSGFVHVPAQYCKTPWWLKIDTDTIATGSQNWLPSEEEFASGAIIAQKWGFTKPGDQMLKLDEWAEREKPYDLQGTPPLALEPRPGSSRLSHARIISWCGFFSTAFTQAASTAAIVSCGAGQMPCGSQDGYLWYFAKRMRLPIIRKNFKSGGWLHRSSMKSVRDESIKAMRDEPD